MPGEAPDGHDHRGDLGKLLESSFQLLMHMLSANLSSQIPSDGFQLGDR